MPYNGGTTPLYKSINPRHLYLFSVCILIRIVSNGWLKIVPKNPPKFLRKMILKIRIIMSYCLTFNLFNYLLYFKI